jgi:hypothetical protein
VTLSSAATKTTRPFSLRTLELCFLDIMKGLDEQKAAGDASDEESELGAISAIPRNLVDFISLPGNYDVICGRGKSVAHPGNQRFRDLVLARKEEYQKAKRRDDKTRITSEIVEALRQGPEPSR